MSVWRQRRIGVLLKALFDAPPPQLHRHWQADGLIILPGSPNRLISYLNDLFTRRLTPREVPGGMSFSSCVRAEQHQRIAGRTNVNKLRLSALVAAGLLAGGLSITSANAADLGGNCCADLEERIAELEATTARKGNRKVSLTVSGWVAEQVMWWDDGVESNVYVSGIGTTLASHFKFTGQATITPGWTAGFVLQIEAMTNDPLALNQASDDAILTQQANVLQSYWFIKSEQLGKVSVGQQSQASDNTAILVDGSGSLVPANWVLFDGQNFFLRSGGALVTDINGGTIGWGSGLALCQHLGLPIGADCNGVTTNSVRYDSPTFGGFSVSASWGEDDFWDIAARYAGEFSGFKIAIAGAYSRVTEGAGDGVDGVADGHDSGYFQVGGYLEHVQSGLFVYAAYGEEDNDGIGMVAADGFLLGAVPDGDHWYIKAGLRQRLNPLGHTVFYGEYGQINDMYGANLLDAATGFGALTDRTADSEMKRWGLGVVQEIDAAAMSIWLSYRHHEGEISGDGPGGVTIDLDEFDLVKFGALINF